MTIAFNDWADLSPGSISIIADNATGGFYPVYSGYEAPGEASGEFPNVIRGKLRLGAGTAHVLLDGVDNFISMGDTPPIVYGNNVGIWMGLDSGVPKISIYKDASNYFKFDGTNIIIGGAITAASGAIGGWTIGATTLSSANITLDSGNDKITVNTITIDGANDRIRSGNYVAGINGAGFTLEPELFEVGNIACRGIFRTGVFQKDVISAIGGNVAISKGADVLATDMTALDASTLTIAGNETFAVGDMLRIKDGAEDEWLEITNDGSAPTYTVTRDKNADYGADANPVWKKGACVVNYGASGDGLIYMTASETYAPYMNVCTHAGAPWSDLVTRLRIGNLNGFLGESSDVYGIAIGEATKYLKYDPTNGLRIRGDIAIESMYAIPSDENLVGYWAFDDGAGTMAIDGSGTGNNGTLNGDPSWEDGIAVGLCLDFDQNDYVNCGSDSSLRITGNRTFTAWIEFSAGTFPNVATNWSILTNELYENNGFIWRIDGTTGKQYFRTNRSGSSSGLLSDTALENNTKYFIAVVIDSGTLTFYLNGVADGGGSIIAQVASSKDFTIGRDGQSFDGKIDEIRAYNCGLTVSEIKALYLYPAGNKASRISGNQTPWAHASDVTKIDGGDIYTNTITASEINGAGFGALTISSGKIAINTTDALEIQAAGNIKCLAGGDIVLIGDNTNPGLIKFVGDSVSIELGLDASGYKWGIIPSTDSTTDLFIGTESVDNWWSSGDKLFKNIGLYADVIVQLKAENSATEYSHLQCYAADPRIRLTCRDGANLYTIEMKNDGGTQYFSSDQNKVFDLGLSTDAWKNIWGEQLYLLERSSDPDVPAEGQCVIWMSNGSGKGDDGDIMWASKAGGTTNYGTLGDHSGGAGW